MALSCSSSFKGASFGSDSDPQTFLEIFGDWPQHLQRDSVALPSQLLLLRLQTFLAISTGPDLQSRPYAGVHPVYNRKAWQPFCRCDETREMDFALLLSRLCPVGQSLILLEPAFCIAKMLQCPQKYQGLENAASVDLLVDFDTLFYKN